MKAILDNCCKVSGQLLNFDNSMVQFLKGTEIRIRYGIWFSILWFNLQLFSSNNIGTYVGSLNIDQKRTDSTLQKSRTTFVANYRYEKLVYFLRQIKQCSLSLISKVFYFSTLGINIPRHISNELDYANRKFF